MSTGSSGMGGDSILVGGRYRMDTKIGEGGMGAVYRAVDTKTGRTVALKLLLDADEKSLARFRREARSAAELRHPHIVGLLDFDIDDPNGAYIVMELVDGVSLSALLAGARDGRLDPARAVAIARQLFSAIGHAHGAGILHRDVKPGNILVSATDAAADYVRLVDFGLAKHTDPAQGGVAVTTMPAMLGTPAYMPPEQMLGETLDARADLYSAGLVLYRMIAGIDAYPETGAQRVVAVMSRQRGRPLQSLAPWADPALAALVDACISPEKSERPNSAAEIVDQLTRVAPSPSTGLQAGATVGPGTARGAPTWSGPEPLALTAHATASSNPYGHPPLAAGSAPVMGAPHYFAGAPPFVPAPPPNARGRSGLVFAVALLAAVAIGAVLLLAVVVFARHVAPVPGAQVAASSDAAGSVAIAVASAPDAAVSAKPVTTPAARATSAGTTTAARPAASASVVPAPAAASCLCVKSGGLGLCSAAQTPSCLCGGAVCKEPWTSAQTCPSGLASFGGPGKKSGEKCSGFQFTTLKGQFVPLPSRTESTLQCNACTVPSRFAGTNFAPCKGINNSGTESEGRLECP